MGFIDKLRRAGGILKNRLASSVGALRGAVARITRGVRGAAAGVTVRGGRTVRGVRFAARGARLLTPAGLALTAVSFAPEIVRGVRAAGRFAAPALARGIAFFGGRQIVTAAAAGGVAGTLGRRRRGEVTRPSEQVQTIAPRADIQRATRISPVTGRRRRPTPTPARRRARAARRKVRRRAGRVPRHRHRVVSIPEFRPRRRRARRTHRSPRHSGHKRVSFTTADGKKVSFLSNPRARHR